MSVVYLAGYGHSGSTLMNMVLNGHSKILGAGGVAGYRSRDIRKRNSSKAKTEKLCSCGAEVSQCLFWRQIFQGMEKETAHGLSLYQSKIDFILGRQRFIHFDKKRVDIEHYLSVMEKIYSRLLKISGKNIVVDSSREPYRIYLLAKSEKIDLTILHLVRDVRGCVASMKKKEPFLIRPTVSWVLRNLEVELIKFRHPEVKHVFVRYEDFVNSPQAVLKSLLKQIGLDFEPDMLRFRSHEVHDYSGNQHKQDRDLPEKIISNQDWKSRLSLMQKALIMTIAGWLNAYYSALVGKGI
jgi:hypothetical protein